MLIRSNAHCHTTFCDGKNTVEEMAQEAIRLGFISLGYSMHGWTPYEIVPVSPEKEVEYREEVRRVREKYAGQLEIILGLEKDYLYDRPVSDYEYYIDSIHWFKKGDIMMCADYSEARMMEYVNTHFGGDFYAYTDCYYAAVAEMSAKSSAAFIGHIDLITKFNEGNRFFDETCPRYLKAAKEAAQCAIDRHVPLEMNTGAISRGYRVTPYPNPVLLKFIREQGGEIIINGDSHSADSLAQSFDTCEELAKAAGFDHVLRMRSFGMEEVGLK